MQLNTNQKLLSMLSDVNERKVETSSHKIHKGLWGKRLEQSLYEGGKEIIKYEMLNGLGKGSQGIRGIMEMDNTVEAS